MNFIPSDSTLTVAKFGLKHFEKLSIPIGNHLIFKNVHGHKVWRIRIHFTLGFEGWSFEIGRSLPPKKLLLLAILISFIHWSSFVVSSFVWLLLHFFRHLFSLCIRFLIERDFLIAWLRLCLWKRLRKWLRDGWRSILDCTCNIFALFFWCFLVDFRRCSFRTCANKLILRSPWQKEFEVWRK